MIFKQYLFLIIVTLCTILVELFYLFIKNNPHLLLGFSLFNISNFDICSLCCSAVLFLSITTLLKLFIASLIDEKWTFSNFLNDLDNNNKIVGFFGIISVVVILMRDPHEEKMKCLLVTVYTSIFAVAILMIKGYDEVHYVKSQDSKHSIGAYWASGCVHTYYEKSFKNCRKRFENFERNNPNVKFLVKKLVLICPLSCNIEGSLADQSDEITDVGHLESIECDQGANYNRQFKTSVFEIYKNKGIFLAAEFPSPLGVLWGDRPPLDKKVKLYHRDCFLKELKEQLKFYPVLILEYDDQNETTKVPLHHFIAESLQNHLNENNHYL